MMKASSQPLDDIWLMPAPALHARHPPIEIQDFVGSLLEKYEGLDQSTAPQVAAILNEMRRDALNLSPLSRARMLSLRLS